MHVLAITGSLRAGSSNTAVLDAARRLAPPGVQVVLFDRLADLPPFNPDDDEPDAQLPPVVVDLRARVAGADALIICSPEYAHGIPGSLKNLLDWLVSSVEFPGKPVALLAASTRSVHAQTQLAEVLRTMSARLVPGESVVLPLPHRAMDGVAIAGDPALAVILRQVMAGLLSAAAAEPR
jgi:NAD(P)H-dependent FMN reductase